MPTKLTVVLLSLLLATPVFIFRLWLLIVLARVAEPCPEECECRTGGIEITCSGPSITAIPLIRFLYVRKLDISYSNITLLEKDSFFSRGLTQLKELNIKECGLRTIEMGAFNGLKKLTDLSITGNELSEIIPGTFQNLNSLEAVELNKKKLQHWDSGVFIGLVNLTYIDLSVNKLQYLHPDTFSRLVNLKGIDLFGNKLQYVHPDTFLGLPKLQLLYLYSNPTLQIPTDRPFIKSHSLSHLSITNCNVSSLSVVTFSNVSALDVLDLSDNNLRTVDVNILRALPKLTTLSLYRNPLQCDCQLQEVWRWCKDRNIWTGYGEWVPKCDTPEEVKGMWWGVLEEGQSLEGNTQNY